MCVYWLYAVLYRCLSVLSMEYCTGLFVWGLEVCAHLVLGGTSNAPDDGRMYSKNVELRIHQ